MSWSDRLSGLARAIVGDRAEAEPSPAETDARRPDPDPWNVSALTGETSDEAPRPLPVLQPTDGPEDAPAPPAAELRTAGLVDDPDRHAALEPAIVAAMRTVFDPEIPVNIYDLGLIYDVIVVASGVVGVRMTLTAPNCPAAQWLPGQVEDKVRRVEGVADVRLDVVFDPPWDKDRMSDAAKLQLGMW
jgi:FeS assembly SUF system protein